MKKWLLFPDLCIFTITDFMTFKKKKYFGENAHILFPTGAFWKKRSFFPKAYFHSNRHSLRTKIHSTVVGANQKRWPARALVSPHLSGKGRPTISLPLPHSSSYHRLDFHLQHSRGSEWQPLRRRNTEKSKSPNEHTRHFHVLSHAHTPKKNHFGHLCYSPTIWPSSHSSCQSPRPPRLHFHLQNSTGAPIAATPHKKRQRDKITKRPHFTVHKFSLDGQSGNNSARRLPSNVTGEDGYDLARFRVHLFGTFS